MIERTTLKPYPTEIQLLLLCARTEVSSAAAQQIRTLIDGSSVDWDHLFTLARVHGITPLLYHTLSQLPSPTPVPRQQLQYLDVYRKNASLRHLRFIGEFQRIIKLLKAAGINAIPYKGAVVSLSAYGDAFLREFSDLDVFVSTADIHRARDILTAQGFERRVKPEAEHVDSEGHIRTFQGYDLINPATTVRLDLQDRFGIRYSTFMLTFADLWERHEPLNLLGTVVPNLSPEDTLLVLCAHGTQHRWQRLKWICDVAELLRHKQNLNWQVVLARAEHMQTTRMLHIGLIMAHKYLDAPLPGDVCNRVYKDRSAVRFAEQTFAWLFWSADTLPNLLRRQWYDFSFDATVRQQWHHKIAMLLFVLRRRLSPRQLDRKNSASLPVLNYLLRPFRVLSRHKVRKPDN